MSIGQAFGIFVAALLLGTLFFNGLIMLISPARWFRLPSYIAFRGSLRERDYLGKAIGRIQIRILGLIFGGLSIYMLGGLIGVHPPRFLRAMEYGSAALILRFRWWLCLVTCLGIIACGFVMLLKPKWWITKYMGAGETVDIRQPLLERIVRMMGLPVLAVGGYFLYLCTAVR